MTCLKWKTSGELVDSIDGMFIEVDKYNVNDVFSSYESYNTTKESVKRIISTRFSNRSEEIMLQIDGEEIYMPYGRFLVNLLVLRAFAEFGAIPKKKIFL